MTDKFNPNDHLMSLKGKSYLEVKWRLFWFRSEAKGKIKTEMLHLDLEKGVAVFKATVTDSEGNEAEGHGSETSRDFLDYIEKAETKAIGRALAALGYGTQFAPELEEGERIVDSPVGKSAPKQRQTPAPKAPRMATEEQLGRIRKGYALLGKQPPDLTTLTHEAANKRIEELTAEYKASKQPKAS